MGLIFSNHPFNIFGERKTQEASWRDNFFAGFEYIQAKHLIFEIPKQVLLSRVQQHFYAKYSASADGGPRSRVRARGTLCSAPHRH